MWGQTITATSVLIQVPGIVRDPAVSAASFVLIKSVIWQVKKRVN
jgi:hypothetical protein